MTKSSNDKYTDPDLRDEIKEEIQAGDKGGEPGQWSARKAQMMAKEYKAQGGGYKDDKKDEKAKHLDKWTDEDWQTKDGEGEARKDGETHRYLPKKAWDKMTEEEKEATDKQKVEGSKAGDQYVPNTEKAKRSRREVSQEDDEAEGKDEDADDQKSENGEAGSSEEGKGDSKRSRTSTKQDVSEAKKPSKDSGKKASKDEDEGRDDDQVDSQNDDIPVGDPDDEGEREAQYLEDDEDEDASEDLEEVDGDEDFDPEAED